MTDSQLPKFNNPPVVETVLSAQFAPLSNFCSAHVGLFWKQYLDSAWDQIKVAPKIEDMFERFGNDKKWRMQNQFIIQESIGDDRLQIVRSDNQRMIQVQNSRFIHNWRKPEGGKYPSYEELLPEFKENFSNFVKFTTDLDSQKLELNQWEVTYVNHLPKGELWELPSDWSNIIPSLHLPTTGIKSQSFDSFKGEWRLLLGDNKGRLYIDMKHVRIGNETGPEILLLQITARGPISDEIDLYAGFDIGHEAIVRTFADMTSGHAHKLWESV